MTEVGFEEFLDSGHIPRLLKTIPEVKVLVSLLKCQICYSLMASPVMTVTGCSHNFCSMCVRSHLTVQQNCPSCFQELHETQIKPNKVLQEIIDLIKLLLTKLGDVVIAKNLSVLQTCSAEISSPVSFSRTQPPFASTSSLSQSGINTSAQERPKRDPNLSNRDQVENEAEDDEAMNVTPKDHVVCPVCQGNILNTIINRHLDECLGVVQETPVPTPAVSKVSLFSAGSIASTSTQAVVQSSQFVSSQVTELARKKNMMKPVTKVVYNLLKDAQIKDLLKKEGLDIKGDRKTLIKRHTKFSILWNAQCEEDNPMSRAEIIRAVKREEQNLSSIVSVGGSASASTSASNQSYFNYDRKSDPKIIEEKQKTILQENKSQYSKLIEEVRRRKLEASNAKASESDKKSTSISILNDGDLEVVADTMSTHDKLSNREEKATKSSNVESEKSKSLPTDQERGEFEQENFGFDEIFSDDDFLTDTPKKETFIATQSKTGGSAKPNAKPIRFTKVSKLKDSGNANKSEVKKKLVESPSKTSGLTNGHVYVTPKRRTSRELLFDEPKKLRQLPIESPTNGTQKTPTSNKTECPVCQAIVQVSLMPSHVDRCLNKDNSQIETRRQSNRNRPKFPRQTLESDPDDPDSDSNSNFNSSRFIPTSVDEDFELESSPELTRSPLLTSTVRKRKRNE